MSQDLAEQQKLQAAGFSSQEVQTWRVETEQKLIGAGFSQKEVSKYFGGKDPDMTPTKKYFETNLQRKKQEVQQGQEVQQATSFLEALEAGWDMSVTGLLVQGEMPDTVLSEDAGIGFRLASQLGTLSGDAIPMVAGAFGGGVAGATGGAAVAGPPGAAVGATVGAGAGAFALPEAIRSILMEHYAKGEIEDFSDFWERASTVFLNTTKQAVVGAATAGVGGIVGKTLGKPVFKALTPAAQVTSEVATMATVGRAVEGEVPKAQDFLDAAILVGGLKGAVHIGGKLRKIYSKTGLKPEQVIEDSIHDNNLAQELSSSTRDLPTKYEGIGKPLTPEAKLPGPVLESAGERLVKPLDIPPKQLIETSPLAENILQRIGVEPGAVKAPLKQKVKKGAAILYKDFVDKFDPILQAEKILTGKKDALTEASGYKLARLVNDYPAKVKHFMEFGTLDHKTLATTGKGFKEIIKPVKNDLNNMKAYLISKRAVELSGRGIKTGFDIAQAKEFVKTNATKYDKIATEINAFNDSILQYYADSGFLSKTDLAQIKELNRSYVSFKRILGEEGTGAGVGKQKAGIKAIKGSEKQIQDPFVSMIENMATLIEKAEANRAKTAFVVNAEKATPVAKEAIGFERVATKVTPIKVKVGAEEVTAFRRDLRPLAANEFQIFRGGKREVYKTDPIVAEAIRNVEFSPSINNVFFKIARSVSTVKRFGITLTPDFIAKNLFRDKLTAGVFSHEGIKMIDVFSAMGDIIGQKEAYRQWQKSGGAQGAFLELGERYIARNVFELNSKTGFIDKAINVIKKPTDMLAVAGLLSEQSLRLAEFKKVSKGAKKGPALLEGGFAAREITVDFQRIGAKTAAFNSITAFQNVSIQGLDRTMRAIKADPKGIAAKGAMFITAPSVLLWWANRDDKRVQNLPRWERDLFWIIATDDWKDDPNTTPENVDPIFQRVKNGKVQTNEGHIFRFPKPQELGIIFGTVPERLLDQFFTDNPRAAKDLDETVRGLIIPSLVPDIAAPAIETFFNRNLFTDRNLVPGYLEKGEPQFEYTHYTSEVAKTVGGFLASIPALEMSKVTSPIVIEHVIKSWTGSLGAYALQAMDKALIESGIRKLPPKPAATLADIPFVKSFVVRFPSAGAQNIQDFFDKYSEKQKSVNSFNRFINEGNAEVLEKHFTDDDLKKIINLDGIRDALRQMNNAINMIHLDPETSRDEKRQNIDEIYRAMIVVAGEGVKAFDELEKFDKVSKE